MEAKASLRHARISPRKVQIVLDLIRNKPADQNKPDQHQAGPEAERAF